MGQNTRSEGNAAEATHFYAVFFSITSKQIIQKHVAENNVYAQYFERDIAII